MTNDELMKNSESQLYSLDCLRAKGDLRCGARMLKDHPERKIKHVWDLIVYLKQDLEKDLKVLGKGIRGKVHSSVVFYDKKNVLIEKGAEVEAGCVLDARQGPIYIGKGTIIKPLSYLRGPLSIGPECRIGGEVMHSIFHGYSNKAHYGFIGHSYIGEWVNLGAGTTNSNLKNNYGSVKVGGVDTGQTFMGCFIGDFVKTGIGTLITTGAVIGVGANVFGGGVTPKEVPAFSWGGEKYELEKFLAGAKAMMKRRKQKLTAGQEQRIKQFYKTAN